MRTYRLPGGRAAVEGFADTLKAIPRGGVVLGPWAWLLTAAAKFGVAGTLERRWARSVARALELDLDIAGTDNIEPGTTYMVAPLHEGFVDVVALLHLPLPLRFVVREELVDWRVLGRYLTRSRHVMVDPEAPRAAYRRLLDAVPGAVAAGESLVVFPQGSILGIEVAFRRGVFEIADRFGLPVLPVVLTGSHRVWEHPFQPTLRFGRRVSVRVLPEIPAGEAGRRAEEIEATMKQMALSGSVASPRRFDPERDGFWDGYRYEIDPRFPKVLHVVERHRAALV